MTRRLASGFGLGALAVCAAATVVRQLPVTNNLLLVIAVGSPYLTIVSGVLAVICFANSRRWVLAVLAAVVAVVASAGPLRFYYPPGSATETRPHTDVRVLTANLRYGLADARFLVDLAREKADLLSVQELTLPEAQRLAQMGIGKHFPYSVLLPAEAAGGAAIWSRYPLEELDLKRPEVGMICARLRIPGVRLDPVFANVHVGAPFANPFNKWRKSMARLGRVLGELSAIADGAVIVAGDFNATPDIQNYRQLLAGGYADAVQQSGAGFDPTYPADRWYPPSVPIDHVLLNGATAVSSHTVAVPGSDHRAVVLTVKLPLDPTAS